jgi:flavin reductase (DIM6/NTAB) family NADH-FMN oxidoreductase RutF
MFYDALKNTHGLKYDPFKALVGPRPIGWISTVSRAGVLNLSPYSFFNAVSEKPAHVMFSSSGNKDSRRNAQETGEFVCNLATFAQKEQMNVSAAAVPSDVDEFALAKLTPVPSHFVKPPRVHGSPAALECKYVQTVELTADGKVHYVVFGLVVGIYIDDSAIKAGIVDTGAMNLIARLGYRDYAQVSPDSVFSMDRPPSG